MVSLHQTFASLALAPAEVKTLVLTTMLLVLCIEKGVIEVKDWLGIAMG